MLRRIGFFFVIMLLIFVRVSLTARAQVLPVSIPNQPIDSDFDGLPDVDETKYGTDLHSPDSDHDGYPDGDEVAHGYDPLRPGTARLIKRIDVDISDQRLTYYYGDRAEQGSFLISSAARGYYTPRGTFAIQKKKPLVTYKGIGYYFPNTKWNLQFLPSFYLHGAFWHNNFGHPMSHGCINVSYVNMEKLYNFADIGTIVTIHD